MVSNPSTTTSKSGIRSTTGCLSCRWRRKKCDEAKPVCSPCQRLKLACRWSSSGKVRCRVKQENTETANELITRYGTVLSRIPVSRDIGRSSKYFTNQTQFTLISLWPTLFQVSLAPYVDQKDQDLSMQMHLALSQPLVRSTLAAFVGFLISNTTGTESLEEACIDNYQEAAIQLRSTARVGKRPEHAVATLFAISILGVLEASHFGNAANAFHHFFAYAYLLPQYSDGFDIAIEPWNVLQENVEMWAVHVANVAMFWDETCLGAVLRTSRWDLIDRVLGKSSASVAWSCQDSARLGVPHQLFILIIQLTAANRRARDRGCIPLEVAQWESRLTEIEWMLGRYYGRIPSENQEIGLTFSHFFLDMLRIFTRKRIDPHPCSSNMQSQAIIAHAVESVMWISSKTSITDLLFWPLSILISSIQIKKSFDTLVVYSRRFHFSKGMAKFWSRLVEANYRYRGWNVSGDTRNCQEIYDGLDLFLLRDGIPSFHEMNSRSLYERPRFKGYSAGFWARD